MTDTDVVGTPAYTSAPVSALEPHSAIATSIPLEYNKRLMLFTGRVRASNLEATRTFLKSLNAIEVFEVEP